MIVQNPKFKPLYTTDKRYVILTGGRASSKSFHTSAFVCLNTYEKNSTTLYSRYTLTSAEISIIPEFKEKIELLEVPEQFAINAKEITNLTTGCEILFRGLKTSSGVQTANLKSLQGVNTWVLDEAEELIDEDMFDKIDLSIRVKNKRNLVVLILNPTTREHWIFKRFFEPYLTYFDLDGFKIQTTTHPDVCHIHTSYLDNIENLSESFLKQVNNIKENNPNKYYHTILGGWIDKAEGVIFDNWNEGEFEESLPYIYGQDYGFSVDPTTLVRVGIDKKNMIIYAEELLYQKGLSTLQIYEANKRLIKNNSDLIIADCAEPRLIEELYSMGLNINRCNKGTDSVRFGINRIKDYKIVVTPNSTNLKKELNLYAWHDKKSETPIDKHNHLLDALRYGVEELLTSVGTFVI